MYQQYRIGFWGTRYDINPITWPDIRASIADMVGIADIDGQRSK